MLAADHPSATRSSASTCTAIPCIRGTIPRPGTGAPVRPWLGPSQVSTVDDTPDFDSDENFEPFDLGEEADDRPRPPASRSRQPNSTGPGGGGGEGGPPGIPCPSCGAPNPPFNRHCESCGARLSQAMLPVAPQPMLRTTAGARALMVLAGVLLFVGLAAVIVWAFNRGGETAAESTSTTSTTQVPLDIVQLRPLRIDCTSELADYPCSALIDDNPDNSWNAREGGVGAVITFLFSPPVQISEVYIHNLEDQERFERNARIKGLEIVIDDLPQATIIELEDSNEPQRVSLRSVRTSSVQLTITSAYPGQSYEGREPFRELAAQEILFYGRISPDTGG